MIQRQVDSIQRMYSSVRILSDKNSIIAQWATSKRVRSNWGDALNPILIKLLSGKEPIQRSRVHNITGKPVYVAIGSILRRVFDPNSVIWGAGFIDSQDSLRVRPDLICAVRGPLTRAKILQLGLDCPEVYGDPALLYPLFYRPSVVKRHELGIIPHYRERETSLLTKFREQPGITIIDITGSINDVVDQIRSCKLIASSSLHGLIAADAYGIPSTWVKFSDLLSGDGFKFKDYFASVGRKEEFPLEVFGDTTLTEIYDRFYEYSLDIDLEKLLYSCPFLHPSWSQKGGITRFLQIEAEGP